LGWRIAGATLSRSNARPVLASEIDWSLHKGKTEIPAELAELMSRLTVPVRFLSQRRQEETMDFEQFKTQFAAELAAEFVPVEKFRELEGKVTSLSARRQN
jgi:uncharacterized protein YeaO (DUF488 family)